MAPAVAAPAKVLILDKTTSVAEDISYAVAQNLGYQTERSIATNEPLAVQRFLAQEWDAVVCNWATTGAQGLDLMKRFRAMDPDVGLLIFTGRSQDEIPSAALKAGLDECLVLSANRERALGDALRKVVATQSGRRKARERKAEQTGA